MSAQTDIRRRTANDIRARKGQDPIVALTSYHAHTARIVFDGRRAVGIDFWHEGKPARAAIVLRLTA